MCFLVFTSCAMVALINFMESKKNTGLPTIPFVGHSIVVLDEDIAGTNFFKNTILLIKQAPVYDVGEKVLSISSSSGYTINGKYDIGLITSIDDDENLSCNIINDLDRETELSLESVVGKITYRVSGVGFIYNTMVGFKGILIFAVIPFLVVLLLFLLFKFALISSSGYEEASNTQGVLDKPLVTGGDNPLSLNQAASIPAENARAEKFVVEKEDVELVVSPVIITSENTSRVKLKKIDKINNTNISSIMEKVSNESKEIQDKKTEPPVKTNAPLVNASNKETQPEIKAKQSPQKKLLSADEILEQYRQNKPKPEHSDVDNMAKLYYQNELESYDK